MRKGIIGGLSILFLTTMLCGCQTATKNIGGGMTLNLEPGQKLEEIVWEGNSLWYLTRPMRDDETAETHYFTESSNMGILEGTVTVIESE